MAEQSLKDKTEIIQYAPVIIPTLNRYEHFKRCLESLEKCTGADKTEVYVGLDYPPAEKYVEGWKKIDEYLQEKEQNNGFAKIKVIRRDHNCGVLNANSNSAQLGRFVRENYDRYIFSEDDNVFSPNFLEYINKGLEKYKDDDKCWSICGYNHYGVDTSNFKHNVFLSHEYSAWGTGFWSKKIIKAREFQNIEYAKKVMCSWESIMTIFHHEPRLLNTIIMNIDCGRSFGDTMYVTRQYLDNEYSLFPTLSKVRNIGFDASGTTILMTNENYVEQPIDENADFSLDVIENKVLPQTMKSVETFFKKPVLYNAMIFVRCLIYYLTKKDILYFVARNRHKNLFSK